MIQQKSALGLLLLLLISFPLWGLKTGVLSLRRIYLDGPNEKGPFTFYHHQIFEEKADIDILFIGPSTLWTAIDAGYLSEKLGDRLHRKATVLVLGNNWKGEDFTDLQLKAVLQNRKVGMLVVSVPVENTEGPHSYSHRWIQFEPGSYSDLSYFESLQIYSLAVLGSPKHMLNMIRKIPMPPAWVDPKDGTYKVANGMNAPFTDLHVDRGISVSTTGFFDPKQNRDLQPLHYSPFQMHYLKSWLERSRKAGIPVVDLHTPRYDEFEGGKPLKTPDWIGAGYREVAAAGISSAALFAGKSTAEVAKYYYDQAHLNKNGNEYFTRSIATALVTHYLEKGKHE